MNWSHDATSYGINDKSADMICDSGLLVANLGYCNPHVYHEVGFWMGRAQSEGKDVADMQLFLDESAGEGVVESVVLKLRVIKKLRLRKPDVELAPALKTNLERFSKLTE